MNKGLLARWAGWAATHPLRVFIVALLVTAVMAVGIFGFLKMEMTYFSIMPSSSAKVKELTKITDDYPFSSAIVVVVDARNFTGEEAKNKVSKAIDDMVGEFSRDEYRDAVKGVYGTFDMNYIRKHGFMLTKTKDLKRLKGMYSDLNLTGFLTGLNNDLEREYSGDSARLEKDENQVVTWVNGLDSILGAMNEGMQGNIPDRKTLQADLDKYLLGDSYYFSKDENMGMFFIQPTYTINDVTENAKYTVMLDEKVKGIAAEYGISAGLTGLVVVGKDEMVTGEKGFGESMVIAFLLILGLLIIVFRMKSTPIIIGVPLFLGVFWAAGLTGFLIQRLNIMTAMYMVVLLGLGVDYAIHIISGYVQEIDKGRNYLEAIQNSISKCSRGIITGALTTAAAFLVLVTARSEVVQELGVVATVGILSELLAMLMLVPALIGNRSRRLAKKGKQDKMITGRVRIKSDFAGKLGRSITRLPVLFIASMLILAGAMAIFIPKVELEDNLMKMEANGLESVDLQDTMIAEFGAAPDVLYYLSDDYEALPGIVDRLDDLATVKYVDSLIAWLPTDTQQKNRTPLLNELRQNISGWKPADSVDQENLLEELYRLEKNMTEMGDLAVLGSNEKLASALNRITGLNDNGDKVSESVFDVLISRLESGDDYEQQLTAFQKTFSPMLAERISEMANSEHVSKADLPQMIRDTLLSDKDNKTLVSITPKQNPWIAGNREKFTAQVDTVTDKATGMILVSDELTNIAEKDGIYSLIAALIIVFIILYIDFRNLKLTIISFFPLGLAFLTLLGIMGLTGIKFDFVNIIAIPLLVGMGIDDTVHINHRYLLEGKGGMKRTIAGTGTAVLMTTITTIIGFASFIPSVMTAMKSTGIVLTLAMGLAFLFSIFFHPSLLLLVSERLNWKLHPAAIFQRKKKPAKTGRTIQEDD